MVPVAQEAYLHDQIHELNLDLLSKGMQIEAMQLEIDALRSIQECITSLYDQLAAIESQLFALEGYNDC